MAILEAIKPKAKKAAATAAVGFVAENPVLSAFLIGIGAAFYLSWKLRRR